MCDGRGYVCPLCRGMRFVHGNHAIGHPDFGRAQRCQSCCEGNNVSPHKEAQVIATALRAYLAAQQRESQHG